MRSRPGRGDLAYDAFISYSHAADGRLAPALQDGLQRLAKPWYRLRALRVFRDDTGLAVNPELWTSITTAMESSRFFVLLCSPGAAASAWVNREIDHWLAHHAVGTILPVLSEGTLVWDAALGDYDPDRSDALPASLQRRFADEPRHLDLRWAREEEELDLRHSRFRGAVADLAAPMHGIAKDDLEGEDVRQHRRARRLAQGALTALAALLAVSLVATVLAISNARDADRATRRAEREAVHAVEASVSAEVDRIVAEVPTLLRNDRTLAALLAVEAQRLRPDAATRGALLSTLTDEPRLRFTLHGGRAGYHAAEVLPDGRRLAALGRGGVDIWDLEARRLDVSVDLAGATGLGVSPDGSSIAAGSNDGTVTIWDDRGRERPGGPLPVGDAPVVDLAFSPDGRTLGVALGALGDQRATTAGSAPRLIDVSDRREMLRLPGHVRSANSIAFSPDGRLVAAGGNAGTVIVHDAVNGLPVGPTVDAGGTIADLSFSLDGRSLVTGGFSAADADVDVFEVATGAVSAEGVARQPVSANSRFNEDGSLLFVAGSGDAVERFRTSDFERVGPPMAVQHGPTQVVPLPSGDLAATGFDGTVSVWRPDRSVAMGTVVPDSPTAGGQFSPDGSVLAAVGNDDTVALYRTDDLRHLRTLSVAGAGARAIGATPVAFSPDGEMLAVGDRLGAVQLFDTRTYARVGGQVQLNDASVIALEFSPDGRFLAATTINDTQNGAFVLDTGSMEVHVPDPPVPYSVSLSFSPDRRRLLFWAGAGGGVTYPLSQRGPGPGRPVGEVEGEGAVAAFSPDGTAVAVGLHNGAVALRDGRTLRPMDELIAVSSSSLVAIWFSRDGRFLMTQDLEGGMRLVDMRERAPVGEPFPGNGAGYGWAGFAPDGGTVALPSVAGTTLVNLDLARWRSVACERAGRVLTEDERRRYLSSVGDLRSACRGAG